MEFKPTREVYLLKIKIMNKILLLITFLAFTSCERKTIEVEKSAGIVAMYPGEGDGFSIGTTEDAQIAVDLILGFADKNVDLMKENMADSIVYWPPIGGESITSALSEIEGVVIALHEPYDSIKRNIWNAIPHKLKGADNSSVTVSFKEDRFYKDGTEESLRIIDRIFINDKKKIYRIHQWTAQMN